MDDQADNRNPVGEASTATPSLPPSVEEAYRRKCIQLKQRTAEVEEANEASRIRLSRLSRQAEKMRIERAFLLEQLTKRTSTNVEDSDGSPSPPPTPKEKPLRTKRGHRKLSTIPGTDAGAATPGSSFANQPDAARGSQAPGSPASEASRGHTNGTGNKKPSSAFEIYCAEVRPTLADKNDGEKTDKAASEENLERQWKDLADAERETYEAKYQKLQKEEEDEEDEDEEEPQQEKKGAAAVKSTAREAEKATEVKVEDSQLAKDTPGAAAKADAAQDEDVEMTNYDTEPEATPSAAGGDGKD